MMKNTMLLSALTGLSLAPAAASAQNVGTASWYGAAHQGLRTTSGEVFDQNRMTAASHDIPLGARVRVTLHDTGRSVIVRVNDRMGARGAIIDLSKGAASQIGLLGRGVGTVSIEPAGNEPVEVAAAPSDDQAEASSAELRHQHGRHHPASASARRGGLQASLVMARNLVHRGRIRHRL